MTSVCIIYLVMWNSSTLSLSSVRQQGDERGVTKILLDTYSPFVIIIWRQWVVGTSRVLTESTGSPPHIASALYARCQNI